MLIPVVILLQITFLRIMFFLITALAIHEQVFITKWPHVVGLTLQITADIWHSL